MHTSSNFVAVCGDCCKQMPLSEVDHVCLPMRRRLMMEKMESLLASCNDGLGVLWLVRIIYRERCKMSGIERYKDRAELARRVCLLLEADNA